MLKWLKAFFRLLGFGRKPEPTSLETRETSRRISRPALVPQPRRQYPRMSLREHVGDGRPQNLQWKASHPSTIARFKAEVTCSRGHAITLRDHTIEQDGRVIPSIVCKTQGCDFHEVVRLEGWRAGRIPAKPVVA